jgi:hypothetical protein
MTPKEKAEELVNKYLIATPVGFHIDDAKKCALIAVDEIVKFMEMDDEYNECLYFANSKWVQYLIEVKQEIEKL